jgi:hypothetical protein
VIRAALPAAALAAGLVLTGCSTTDTAIGAGTATSLQQEVRHIAGLAAAHRYPAALSAAAALRSDLRTAVDTGRVPRDRAVHIGAALDLVVTDLRTAQGPASPSPSPTATPTPTRTPTPTPRPTPTVTPAKRVAGTQKEAAKKAAETWKKVAERWKEHRGKGRGHRGD